MKFYYRYLPYRLDKKINQRGSVVIFSLIFVLIMLTVSVGLLNIFLSKLKVVQDVSSSLRAIYAADSAVELCLYEARMQPVAAIARNPQGSADNNWYGSILTNGATFNIASLSANPVTVTNDCRPIGTGFNFKFRTVGNYKGVSRSIEITQ